MDADGEVAQAGHHLGSVAGADLGVVFGDMQLNRCGFMPAEECLLGVVSSGSVLRGAA